MRALAISLALLSSPVAAQTLDPQTLRDCVDREQVIARLDAEIFARGRRLHRTMQDMDELRLQAATLRDTARVDASARIMLMQVRHKQEGAQALIDADESRLDAALREHEQAVTAFNLACAGQTYDPDEVLPVLPDN